MYIFGSPCIFQKIFDFAKSFSPALFISRRKTERGMWWATLCGVIFCAVKIFSHGAVEIFFGVFLGQWRRWKHFLRIFFSPVVWVTLRYLFLSRDAENEVITFWIFFASVTEMKIFSFVQCYFLGVFFIPVVVVPVQFLFWLELY